MKVLNFSMWLGDKKISLYEILNNLRFFVDVNWLMYEFWGVRDPFNGSPMQDFERKLRSTPTGYPFSSAEIEEFSRKIEDLNDLILVGFHDKKKAIEIEGFDSATWRVVADENLVDSLSLENFVVRNGSGSTR